MFIGLTGGMGCGKSTASAIFAKLAWQVLDADDICHSLYEERDGQLLKLLIKRWGEVVINPNGIGIDREKVSNIIFNSSEERKWLNATIHPLVLKKALDIYATNSEINTLFDVPLLYESGWENHFDSIVAIWTNNKIRTLRLRKRGMSDNEIERRDAAQMSIERKVDRADYALINNGSVEQLRAQCAIISNAIGTHSC